MLVHLVQPWQSLDAVEPAPDVVQLALQIPVHRLASADEIARLWSSNVP